MATVFDTAFETILGRVRPDVTAYRLVKALETLQLDDSLVGRMLRHRALISWRYDVYDAPLADALRDGVNEMLDTEPSSYMSAKMRKGPSIDAFLTSQRVTESQSFYELAGEPFVLPTNAVELVQCVETMRRVLHAGQPIRWKEQKRKHSTQVTEEFTSWRGEKQTYVHTVPRKGKRGDQDKLNTFTALYRLRNDRFRNESLPEKFRGWSVYKKYMTLLGVLEGRLRNFFASNLKAESARMDKSGLTTFGLVTMDELHKDLNTAIWLAMCVSEFSVRKAFTLESQQHGALNEHSKWMFDEVLMKSETTNWNLVALVFPTEQVLKKCSMAHLETMEKLWLNRLSALALFLRDQFSKGVRKSAERDADTCMMVPRRGSGVDSTGWNDVSGAWNNAVRQLRGVANALGHEIPPIFKCMKLTAGDQMQWAQMEQKEVDKSMNVFHDLVLLNVLPWSALDGMERETIVNAITETCGKHGVPVQKWLGGPRERSEATRDVHDQICGIACDVPKTVADVLKYMGVFGASPALPAKNSPVAQVAESNESEESAESAESEGENMHVDLTEKCNNCA